MTWIDAGPPAWTEEGTLLLPVPPALWPPPPTGLRLDGTAFAPKRELHVTLVGRALGAELRELAEADAGLRRTAERLGARFDGRLARQDRWLWLQKAPGVASIVQCIDLPAMAALHAALGELLARVLPVPPPHVTLYTAGRSEGIGVPDPDTLRRLAVRELTAVDLQAAAR